MKLAGFEIRRSTLQAQLTMAALCVTLAVSACGRSTPPETPASQVIPELGAVRVERRELDERPPINLVARVGDPAFAVGFAAAHDFGSTASVALSSLLVARLNQAGFTAVASEPHDLGFQIYSLVRSEAEASQFIEKLSAAVAESTKEGESGLALAAQNLTKLRARSLLGTADANVGNCSGEAAIAPGATLVDLATANGRAELEKWRAAIHSADAAAFAALGPPDLLDAAAKALGKVDAWPTRDKPEDPWPERDTIGADLAEAPRKLSVALRLPSADAAISAAKLLGNANSDLELRLSTFSHGWRLERSSATARTRGACLRLDALAPPGDPGPSAEEAARAAKIVLEEAERALSRVGEAHGALDESIVRPSDPRQAVSRAAWRALVERADPGPVRRAVSLTLKPSERTAANEFAPALALVEKDLRKQTLETRVRAEPGQGEFWILLANTCGTTSEGTIDAGLLALATRTLASRDTGSRDVELEPWVTPDGIGVLAHAPRLDPTESPDAQAERVATGLARALVGRRLSGSEVSVARENLLEELGPGPMPAFWQTLEAVAPEHPSWVEARGTWSALSEASQEAVESRHRTLLGGPLRLAVIASSGADQAKPAISTLERWLWPLRREGQRCPNTRIAPARAGILTIETASSDAADAAYIAAQLPAKGPALPPEAEATLILMNRRGGWLEQALVRSGGAASARARILGGSRAQALIIEIRAEPSAERDALAQVRGLLDRLARGAASAADLAVAEQERERLLGTTALDPRRRIVDLWRGSAASPALDLANLRAFHATLRADTHVVVQISPKP